MTIPKGTNGTSSMTTSSVISATSFSISWELSASISCFNMFIIVAGCHLGTYGSLPVIKLLFSLFTLFLEKKREASQMKHCHKNSVYHLSAIITTQTVNAQCCYQDQDRHSNSGSNNCGITRSAGYPKCHFVSANERVSDSV